MTVTCKKCGEKYVSVLRIKIPKEWLQSGENVEEIRKGTIDECSRCK